MSTHASQAFTLARTPFGKLLLSFADGTRHEGVVPVRAFPISAPDRGIALVSTDGKELVWIAQLADLDAAARQLVAEELGSREFMPQIQRIRSVSGFTTPSVWEVDTDRGPTAFTLKGEEDIRRLAAPMLLIADSHGVQYLIRDFAALDRPSRKLLDRFL
ncbi:DUF1854 domain-containing protein [Imbroritus primus]|uniref:DUF1854 domain-containing protein n=1 Tax=Imbroritus primus TaxID=3058603 RepID=A0ACD3SQ53_9BURK|nr:DUF1854 domain-containing protein [Burkholderiaceae bacterium PBA]